MAPKLEVKQPEGEEIGAVVLATAIVEIAAGMKRINATRLSRKALLVLLSHETKLPQYQVDDVLNALGDLEKLYCKTVEKKR